MTCKSSAVARLQNQAIIRIAGHRPNPEKDNPMPMISVVESIGESHLSAVQQMDELVG